MSVQVSYKKQFVIFLMLIVVILIVTEITIRIADYYSTPCDFTKSPLFDELSTFEKWEMCRDYSSINMLMNYKYYIDEPINLNKPNQNSDYFNINSHGFRGQEVNSEKQDDTFRIFFVGGSTAFGYVTMSDDSTISGFLETKLDESIQNEMKIEVINAGIADADTQDELYYIQNTLINYEPDMIILYDGWNDIVHRHRDKINIPYDQFIENDYYENRHGKNHFSPDGLFLKIDYQTGFRAYKFLYLNLVKPFTNPIESSPHSYGHFTQLINSFTKNNWNSICELGKKNNFIPIIVLQPILGSSERIMHEYEKKYLEDGTEFERMGLKYLKDFDLESKSHKFSQSCDYVFDLRNSLKNVNEPIYFDHGHMSDFGYEIIADKLNPLIVPIIKSKQL